MCTAVFAEHFISSGYKRKCVLIVFGYIIFWLLQRAERVAGDLSFFDQNCASGDHLDRSGRPAAVFQMDYKNIFVDDFTDLSCQGFSAIWLLKIWPDNFGRYIGVTFFLFLALIFEAKNTCIFDFKSQFNLFGRKWAVSGKKMPKLRKTAENRRLIFRFLVCWFTTN